MKKYLLTPILSLSLNNVFLQAAELKTAGKVHTEIQKNQLIIKTDSGFHLNKEAPAILNLNNGSKLKPESKSTEFIFKLPTPSGKGNLEVYACDDQNTVCEPHKLPVIWGSHKENLSSSGESDFIINNYTLALSEAKKSNKLIFIDFGAKWCPPCIRLEHEVFNTGEFRALKKDYILLNLDVDLESNNELMQKHSVKAFPSLVIVNAQGKELARFLDFQEKSNLVSALKNIVKSKPLDVDTLIAQSQNGDPKTLLALAEYYNKSLQPEEAVKMYEKSLGIPYFESKISALEENTEGSGKILLEAALKNAIEAYPNSFQSLNWQVSLAKSAKEKSEEKIKLLQAALSSIQNWIDHPEFETQAYKLGLLLEIKDLVLPEVYALQAEVYEELQESQKSKDSYEKAVKETLKLNPSVHNPTVIIYLVSYMKPVRPLADIEPWLEKLEAAYPNEFTYPQRHAKLLLDKGQARRALDFAKRAHFLSYGNNKFTSGLLLAQVQVELHQKGEAKKLLNQILATQEAQSPRNKRVVKSIQDFLKKIL